MEKGEMRNKGAKRIPQRNLVETGHALSLLNFFVGQFSAIKD
jgi:hypothetical protein